MAFQQAIDNPIVDRWTWLECERVKVTEWIIQVRDAYNLNYAYTMIHDWILEEGWGPRDDMFFPETYYMQREHPTFGKEIWLRWRLTKNPPATKGGLFTYMMDVDWKMLGVKDTEIAWKGQKIKADRSEFEVTCKANLLIDRKGEWKTWPFANIKELYTRRIMRQKIAMHKKSIYADAYRLRDLMMNYLKLETFMPTKETGEFFVKRTLE